MSGKHGPWKANMRQLASGNWQARVRRKGAPAQSEAFATKTEAKNWLIETNARLNNGCTVPRRVLETTTFGDLLRWFRDERVPLPKRYKSEKSRAYARGEINRFLAHPIAQISLINLRKRDFEDLKNWLLKQPNGRGGTLSNETVIRKLNLLQAAIADARDLREELGEWDSPMHKFKMPDRGEPRQRRIGSSDLKKLVRAWRPRWKVRQVAPDGTVTWKKLRAPYGCRNPFIPYVIRIAKETSLRKQAVVNILYEHVDWENSVLNLPWVVHKNGKVIPIPVSFFALNLMRRAWLEQRFRPPGDRRICPINLSAFDSGWDRLRERAGLHTEDLHFHDTRTEAISSSLDAGLSIVDAMKMANIKDPRTIMRYVNLSQKSVVDRLHEVRESIRKNPRSEPTNRFSDVFTKPTG